MSKPSAPSTWPKRLGTAALVALGSVACASLLLGQASPNRAVGPPLPTGPTKTKAERACLGCHNASIIVQQQLDPSRWTREVDKMIRWGAPVEPADRETLIDYFSKNFAPRELSGDLPLPEGRGVAQVRAACLGCHGTDLIVQTKLDRPGWDNVLKRMEAWGARAEPEDRKLILDYFAKHFSPARAAPQEQR